MPSTLAELRALAPRRHLAPWEARLVAERQANRLLQRMGAAQPPVPEQIIEHLPRVEVRYRRAQRLSGMVRWTGGRWVILVNTAETWGRQRFSLSHEFKHLLDWPFGHLLYPEGFRTSRLQAERAADAFAAAS